MQRVCSACWAQAAQTLLFIKLSLVVMHVAVEDAVAQADAAEGDLQPAASGDSQQRGSTPDGTVDAEDAADSGLTKSGRKAHSKGSRKLPAGCCSQRPCASCSPFPALYNASTALCFLPCCYIIQLRSSLAPLCLTSELFWQPDGLRLL